MNEQNPASDVYNRIASEYADKFMDLHIYDETYDRFCKLLEKQNASVLELACGPGNITRYILAKRPDLMVDATDIAPNMIALARQNNPTANCFVLDCREMATIHEKYDGVICGFCVPYLDENECRNLIANSASILKDGGVLYLSAIEGEYSQSKYETSSKGTETLFIHYYPQVFLSELLQKNGFSPPEIFRIEYAAANGPSFHLILIAKKLK